MTNLHLPLDGTGKAGPMRHCQICHYITHPRGLCPFPKLNGWMGPKHNPTANSEMS
jgi:hypothetical protein